MALTRVGVLRGGPSSEYEVSLKSGASVLRHLPEKYTGIDIFISKNGIWHMRGVPVDPAKALSQVDVAFNALHGTYGEDGTLQKKLDELRVPYTGSRVMPSILGFQKHLFKETAAKNGLRTPRHFVYRADADEDIEAFTARLHKGFAPPWIVKPAASGSSVGVSLVRTLPELPYALEKTLFHGGVVLVEEYVRGREATCAVLEDFRGEDLYAFFPIEIAHGGAFFDYGAKYGGAAREICPGNFTKEQKEEIAHLARKAHLAVGARHYSRTDMIVSPRGVFVLEINTLPGLTSESLLPKSLDAVGASFPQFLDHVISRALAR